MPSVFVVAAYAVVGSGSVVGMMSVTCDVAARCWSVLDIRMRTVCAGLHYSCTMFVVLMRESVRHVTSSPFSAPRRRRQRAAGLESLAHVVPDPVP